MSLIAHYPLIKDVKDYSGNNVPTTSNNITYANGKIGNAAVFNTSGISISNNDLKTKSTFSVGIWVKSNIAFPSASTSLNWRGIIGKVSGGDLGQQCFYLDWYGTNETKILRYGVGNATKSHKIECPDFSLTEWTHIVISHHDRKMKLYVNGVLNTVSTMDFDILITADAINIGGFFTSFSGQINDVRIYDHELSIKEVKEIAKAKILHYKFDDMQEPTTNLVPSPLVFSSGWSSYMHGNDGIIKTELGTEGIQMINRMSWCGAHKSITLPEPGTYTLTVYTKVHNVTHQAVRPTLYTTGGGLTDVLVAADNTKIGEWQRLQMTQTYTETTINLYLICYGGVQEDTHRITAEYTMPQIEKKDHATDFVDGSRTGQIKDCSGLKNDSILLTEQYSPQWIKKSKIGSGCYKFNGENKHIEVSPYTTKHKQLSFSIWINEHSFSNAYPFFKDMTMLFNLETATTVRVRCCNGSWATDIYGTTNARSGWNHYVYTFDNGIQKLYFNGVLLNTVNAGTTEINWNANNLRIGHRYDTDNYPDLNASIDDVRFYATSLSQQDVQDLYSVRTAINKDGTVFCSSISTNSFKPTLVDYSTWNPGSMPNGWRLCGSPAENSMVVHTNPIGEKDIMWATLSNDADSGADGGFDTTVTGIDNTKKYRVSVWVRRENVGNGRSYLGVGGNTVHRTSNKALDDNPYFVYPLNSDIPNGTERRWLLYIGHIFPAGYTGGMDTESGIWDPVTRTKVLENNTDFYWADNAINTTIRSYLFYSTATQERQYWYRPRIEECDGNQPTLSSLLRCSEHGALLNFEKQNISSSGIINCTNISEVGITKNLIAYYPLDSNLKDYSGRKNNLTGNYIATHGMKDQSIKTQGMTTSPNRNLAFSASGTISIWAKHNQAFNANMLFSFNSDSHSGPDLYIAHDTISWNTGDGGNNPFMKDGVAKTYPSINEWHHYVVVNDRVGQKTKLYIDGEYAGEAIYKSTNQSNSKKFVLGAYFNTTSYIWQGCIDDVKLSSDCWSEKEIKIEYETTKYKKVLINKDGTIYANSFNDIMF